MSIIDWAERECRIACKGVNPKFNFDDDSENNFNYVCSCYKDALKAYKVLCSQGHSGQSWQLTTSILNKLCKHQPLTPITDSDFFAVEYGTKDYPMESPAYLKERGLKSNIQCPRMFSLFREETLDGKVSYTDIDRSYCVNMENEEDTYSGCGWVVDELFPITLPYLPSSKKYKIYTRLFLTDENNGDFDTREIRYMITPEGERVDINRYFHYDDSGSHEVTKEEFDRLLSKRIDPLSGLVAYHIKHCMLTDLNNSEREDYLRSTYSGLPNKTTTNFMNKLIELCRFFDKEENWHLNTNNLHWDLADEAIGEDEFEVERLKEIKKLIKEFQTTYLQ